jgi:hypothetical protein
MLPLLGLSPVSGKSIAATFDGGLLSSDGGVLMLREVEQRLRMADRFAGCIEDPRAPDQITHTLADMIRFRLLMIAAGYEDGNAPTVFASIRYLRWRMTSLPRTANRVRSRPSRGWRTCPTPAPCCALAVPWSILIASPSSGSQTHRARYRQHVRCGSRWPAVAVVQCALRRIRVPPIVVFDGEGRFTTAVLRPAKRPGGKEVRAFLRRLLRAIRTNWPNTQILLHADSHYCCPEVLDWCRANGLDYILGVAPTTTLRRHIEGLEARTKARFEAAPKQGKARRFKEFFDGAASWSRVERIVARVEAGAEGLDTRFIVTNLKVRNARVLHENVYCRRGQAENHIKSWKTHLAADRTSCTKATANQLPLFLHAGAYLLMWGLRVSMPRRSMWSVAQFDTLRLRLIKIAARVVEMKTMIRIHLPTSCPTHDLLRLVLGRIPGLVT